MDAWFTSDTHYGHTNILKYSKRPFKSVEEMDEALINNYNARVKKGDRVFFVGDFCFRDRAICESILSRLNGDKFLIAGNHDKIGRKAKGWAWVGDYKEVTVPLVDGTYKHPSVRSSPGPYGPEYSVKLVLCHYAMRVWNRSHNGSLMLYGHSHGSLSETSQTLDVGVDSWGYKPISIYEIMDRMLTRTSHVHADYHQPREKGDET